MQSTKKRLNATSLKSDSELTIFNNRVDFLLIKFPILFPVLYLSALFVFPNYGMLIAFVTLIALAEPHFGATWSVFFDKRMRGLAMQKNYFSL